MARSSKGIPASAVLTGGISRHAYTSPEQTARPPYAPIGLRDVSVAVKTLGDGRLAYRATCTRCNVGGCWLTDRVTVERNASNHECAATEAA